MAAAYQKACLLFDTLISPIGISLRGIIKDEEGLLTLMFYPNIVYYSEKL